MFGARASTKDLMSLVPWCIAVNVAFIAVLVLAIGPEVLAWFGVVFISNFCYNTLGWKGMPILDMVAPLGMLCVTVLSEMLNGNDDGDEGAWACGATAFIYAGIIIVRTHLWGQLMDFDADRAVGKRTTAVSLGSIDAGRYLLLFILICELAFTIVKCPGDVFLPFFSALSCVVASTTIDGLSDRVQLFGASFPANAVAFAVLGIAGVYHGYHVCSTDVLLRDHGATFQNHVRSLHWHVTRAMRVDL